MRPRGSLRPDQLIVVDQSVPLSENSMATFRSVFAETTLLDERLAPALNAVARRDD